MPTTRDGSAARAVAADAGLGALLVAYHAAVHGRGRRRHRLAANLGLAGLAVGVARGAGLDAAELGLARSTVAHGLRTGTRAAIPVVGAIAAAAAWPRTRASLARSVEPGRAPALAYDALVRIPFETAMPEELVFRGLAYAMARRHGSHAYATTVTSVTFGLWHVGPARHRARRSADPGAGALDVTRFVAADVAVTALANVVFVGLRRRSDSVWAPFVLHAAVNVASLTAARWAARSPR